MTVVYTQQGKSFIFLVKGPQVMAAREVSEVQDDGTKKMVLVLSGDAQRWETCVSWLELRRQEN